MFKTELHCHSCQISQCARVSNSDIIEKFTQSGYSTVVLTNHFSRYTMEAVKATDWNDWVDKYVSAYESLKADAAGKLNILFGIELHFDENSNDYLVFGVTEKMLKENVNLFASNPEAFHKITLENGCLFIQAHPFRNGMTVVRPEHLDGVEVFNGHFGHDSRNEIAEMWAEKFDLIKTAGTDFHYMTSPANGGILTECEITSTEQLIEILKSGNYTLNKQLN